MVEIDISSDLAAVTEQIQKGIEELQELDGKRQTLAQQIQNLNGVAMYLRGRKPLTLKNHHFHRGMEILTIRRPNANYVWTISRFNLCFRWK